MGYRNPFGALTYNPHAARGLARESDPTPKPRPGGPEGSVLADWEVDLLNEAVKDERQERNRIARECAEMRQERDRLQELVNRLSPLAEAAIAEDIAEEMHDSPDGAANPLIVSELAEARAARRNAVADWHLQQMADRAEGRAPLDVTG